MSDSYSQHLPFAFPWVIEGPRNRLRLYIRSLMSANHEFDGSSFAYDVARSPTRDRLWLSDASRNYLMRRFNSVAEGTYATMGTPDSSDRPPG